MITLVIFTRTQHAEVAYELLREHLSVIIMMNE